MSEEYLREFFADVRYTLHINIGQWCDRNLIFRSDFTNFMKGKKYYTSIHELEMMMKDIMNNCESVLDAYKKGV